MKTEMTFDEMVKCLEFWDMAMACSNCFESWWGENYTRFAEDFHVLGCPLKGRRDVHEAFGLNYDYLDEKCRNDHRREDSTTA